MRTILLGLFLMLGCAAQNRDDDHRAPARAMAMPQPTKQIIGQSVLGKPIEMYQFGAGPRPVLVMGAIHGSEPTSTTVARGLLEELRMNPTLAQGVPVAIIPVANPDGLATNSRTNVHKVDLNRNFPANNWSARSNARSRNNFGGAQSASEPEAAALIATIERLGPRLIISIHSMDKPCNNYDGPAKHISDLMSRYNGYPSVPTIGYPTPGSLGSWAGIDRQISMITLELPRKQPGDKAWESNRAALLAAIASVK